MLECSGWWSWLAAGRRGTDRLGGFELVRVVGGIPSQRPAGMADQRGDWRKVANPRGRVESLVQTWHEVFGCAGHTKECGATLAERETFGHLRQAEQRDHKRRLIGCSAGTWISRWGRGSSVSGRVEPRQVPLEDIL